MKEYEVLYIFEVMEMTTRKRSEFINIEKYFSSKANSKIMYIPNSDLNMIYLIKKLSHSFINSSFIEFKDDEHSKCTDINEATIMYCMYGTINVDEGTSTIEELKRIKHKINMSLKGSRYCMRSIIIKDNVEGKYINALKNMSNKSIRYLSNKQIKCYNNLISDMKDINQDQFMNMNDISRDSYKYIHEHIYDFLKSIKRRRKNKDII